MRAIFIPNPAATARTSRWFAVIGEINLRLT